MNFHNGFLTWGAAEYFPFAFELILSRSLLLFFSSKFHQSLNFISLTRLKKWPYAAQRYAPPIVTMWSQICQKLYQSCVKVLPKLQSIFLKLNKTRLQVASMLFQVVPKCCPSVVFKVPKWCQRILIYVTMWPQDVLSECL